MSKEFETHEDAAVEATPEEIWDAIATGPGVSTWFVGRTDIDGETVRTAFGDNGMPASRITAADPPHRFAHRSDTAPDGRYIAYEYLIEGHDRSATVLRTITSGFLPGDDWADEYQAMTFGNAFFFATLVEHLRRFPGRTATSVTTFGPPVADWPTAWTDLHTRLGVKDPHPGDPVPAVGGEVYFTNPQTLGIRTPTALHRYIQGFHGAMVECHSHYA